MQEQQKQLVERLKQAQNILITVSKNPTVDQLAAAIGLTLALGHLDKHATAVFSGTVPSTLEFLRPKETLEPNTDSLRDFIIALDKSKADKLRYKVEDNVVRIFITPFRTSISEKDLNFSQGDFNVDVVVALGVAEQQDLDEAIVSHGRILHDATVATINIGGQASLGSINWNVPDASSLSELVVNIVDALDKQIIDSQIATALLTGIVSATGRFRNDKTTPKTMSVSAELMAAGANQQLIATQLEAETQSADSSASQSGEVPSQEPPKKEKKPDPGTLEINHETSAETQEETKSEPEESEQAEQSDPTEEAVAEPAPRPQVHVDENGQLSTLGNGKLPEISKVHGVASHADPFSSEHPAESIPTLAFKPAEHVSEPSRSAFDEEDNEPGFNFEAQSSAPAPDHSESIVAPVPDLSLPAPVDAAAPISAPLDSPNDDSAITPDETLTEIEAAVDSPHAAADSSSDAPSQDVDSIRSAVEAAYEHGPAGPPLDLNALPLGNDLHVPSEAAPTPLEPAFVSVAPTNSGFSEPTPGTSPADRTLDMPIPQNPFGAQPSASPFGPPPQSSENSAPIAAPATFGPSSQISPFPASTSPSVFPGVAPAGNAPQSGASTPPPPVPPPMLPPLQ